jgi:hypothetical protein
VQLAHDWVVIVLFSSGSIYRVHVGLYVYVGETAIYRLGDQVINFSS